MNREEIRGKEWNYPFVVYYPSSLNKKLPLIIQLHGAGERGDGEDELIKVEKTQSIVWVITHNKGNQVSRYGQ